LKIFRIAKIFKKKNKITKKKTNTKMNFPLKTGYSFDDQYNNNNNEVENYMKDVIVLLGIFTKDAIDLAEIYVNHANRNRISTNDLELALKTRAYHGDHFWNHEDIQQKITDMKKYLYDEDNDDDNDEDDDEDDNDAYHEPPYNPEYNPNQETQMDIEDNLDFDRPDTPFTKSICTCNVCVTLNEINGLWDSWNPSSNMEIAIKNSINNTLVPSMSNPHTPIQ
jgi:hypothetical protein